MVELLHRQRAIKIKIVYYGPPVGGKTTNLQMLHRHARARRHGEMISINSAQDRTILFDLLPLRASGFRGFDLRLQVLAVPGQGMYAATRRLVLKGADSIVFVANSASDRWEENLQSYSEMTRNLLAHQLDPASIPLVLQFNKRDLPETTPFEFMERALNARRVDAFGAVAVQGEGVLETLGAALLRTVQDLASRYQIVEKAKGRDLPEWTRKTIEGMFGVISLSGEPAPRNDPETSAAPDVGHETEAPGRRVVRVTLPEEATRSAGTGPDARANETLVESYAQASAQLGTALGEIRLERDRALGWLADVRAALDLGQRVLAGQPLVPTLRAILERMSVATTATAASFLTPESDGEISALTLINLDHDPLLNGPSGLRATRALLDEGDVKLSRATDSRDLGDVLAAHDPELAAVVSVPVRTPGGLQSVAMLYFSPDAALPHKKDLDHIRSLALALAAPLELARALERVKGAERAQQLAAAGAASVIGLDEILSLLVALRERFGSLRHRPAAPPWLFEESTHIAHLLAGALATTRSLLAFTHGTIEPEPVVVSDLFDDLAPGVGVRISSGAENVQGDPALLRVALKALIEELRSVDEAGSEPAPICVQAATDGSRVRLCIPDVPVPLPRVKGPSTEDRGRALAGRIAEMHGGNLSVEHDTPGVTRFSLYLPSV